MAILGTGIFNNYHIEVRVKGLGLRVKGLGFRVKGAGFRV